MTLKSWREFAALLVLIVAATFLEVGKMTSYFDQFDFSGFIDVFYRVYSGQRPYVDFFYNAGPVHPYIGALFFRVFGPGKPALIANACALSIFMSVYAYALAHGFRNIDFVCADRPGGALQIGRAHV